MQSSERLHSLDAVRAAALLLGVALHAAQPFIAGLPWIVSERPDPMLEGVWYAIHLFRMPLFFLLAGLFGRMILERRGLGGFISDRAQRILVPLAVGLPLVMLLVGIAVTGATLLSGGTLGGAVAMRPPSSPVHHNWLSSINLMHLWFLYYLVLFYAVALTARAVNKILDLREWLSVPSQALVRNWWGPLLFAAPSAAYYTQLDGWSPWGGLPAPFSLIPDPGALIGYGSFFAFGWLLHSNIHHLSVLKNRWPIYSVLAIILWGICRTLAGSTPHWGPFLKHSSLLTYTSAYVAGSWCWTLALISISTRFVTEASHLRRYLADSSYWIYLVHLPVLFFFQLIFHPLHLQSGLKYIFTLFFAMTILLLSYHYLVRFTVAGRVLNGTRYTRRTQQRANFKHLVASSDPASVAADIQ